MRRIRRTDRAVQNYLKEKNVPHVWHVDSNAHDGIEWTVPLCPTHLQVVAKKRENGA
jgi:hypothetical protein